MISPAEFVDTLKKYRYTRFTGVPCSFFQNAINVVLQDPDLQYTMVPNEGSALALASGQYIAGSPSAVLIQNSGFGNLINPLTSLNMIYRIPVLIFMSGRAYGVMDEPQHEVIGKTMGPVLQAIGVRFAEMPADGSSFDAAMAEAVRYMKESGQPFFFLVPKGTVEDKEVFKKHPDVYPLRRMQAIQIISSELAGEELVIATTGKPSRELFTVYDRKSNFYMQGSMGHASAIGLGLAMEKPHRKIVVLDGDGALLMHLGILSSIGHYKPRNFYHIVLDNEAYETTGDQDTTSASSNFEAMALACGYRSSITVSNEATLRAAMKRMMNQYGPAFLRVKINRQPTPDIGRISSKYSAADITQFFKQEATSR